MKKLMILAVAIAASVVANAAAVSWDSGTIALPDSTQAGKGAVSAYLFIVDADTYNAYAAYTDATKLSDDIYATYKGSMGSADATKNSTAKGVANLDDGVDRTAGTYYGVVLYTTTQDAKDYWMGNYASATIEASQDVSVGNLALKMGGTGNATAWSTAAVPEPTSGLLMLLGMAGLALRRRRA